MDYNVYKQGNNLYVDITRGGFVGTIMVERVGYGTFIRGIRINRPKGGKGGALVTGLLPIRYKVIFPNNHKTFDNRKQSVVTPEPTASGYSLLSPVIGNMRLTSGYGWRDGKFHRGQDYARPPKVGEALKHMRDGVKGTLYRYYEKDGFGRWVYIKCDDGFGIVLAHLQAYGVANGARVDRNSVIGYLGDTGHATAAHVHIELHKVFGGGFTKKNAVPFKINTRIK